MLAIADGRPELLGLKDIIRLHTDFHYEVVSRKYKTLLEKEMMQKEIKEGLIQACDIIDLIIEILRGSKNLAEAKACLMTGDTGKITFRTQKSKKAASKLSFTERQAAAILEMRLYRLIGLEILALQEEYAEILKRIQEYEEILSNPEAMKKVIKKDLQKIKKEYGFERKTALENAKAPVVIEEAVEEREVVFVKDRFGYGKILEKNIYERNQEAVEEEYRTILPCMNTDKLCIFTQNGIMHQVKVQDIPGGRLREKGMPLDNLCNYDSRNEQILFIVPDRQLKGNLLLFVTRTSLSKIVDGTEFLVQKKTVAATKLSEGDELAAVMLLTPDQMEKGFVVMQSEEGYFLRFPISEITKKKKNALGIRGMSLKDEDQVRQVYVTEAASGDSILYKDKELYFQKIRQMTRDSRGVKVRR